MNSKPNKLKTLSPRIKKIFWILGLRAFSLILILVLADIILGGYVFYKYVFLAESQEPMATETVIKFNYQAYQRVSGVLQKREASSGQAVMLKNNGVVGQSQKPVTH